MPVAIILCENKLKEGLDMTLIRYNTTSPWSVLDDMMDLQDDVNRFFETRSAWAGRVPYPLITSWMEEDKIIVQADLPGVDSKDVEVTVKGNQLTISGKREQSAIPEKASFIRRELGHGPFSRTLALPFGVESGKITAHFKNGLLTVTLPRAEAEKPRRISIESAA